jgi:tRNA-specific adenosine deaminase 1
MNTADSLVSANVVAALVLEEFDSLPKTGKPQTRKNGIKEWTVVAGVTLEYNGKAECVSLATGVKALPDSLVGRCNGNVLHDMHAEVLALRAFNRFAIEECAKLKEGIESEYFAAAVDCLAPYKLRDHVKASLYVSDVPCGDASMSLISQAADNDIWTEDVMSIGGKGILRGREHCFIVGCVRTKPGRKDSPLTLSKSCTDKLTIKQFTSLISGVAENLIQPVYLSRLVLPDSGLMADDVTRAFRSRLELPRSTLLFHPFAYDATQLSFEFSRSRLDAADDNATVPSPCSIVWIRGMKSESIVEGVKSGVKPFKGKGQSLVCRRQLASRVMAIQSGLSISASTITDYLSLKTNTQRTQAKYAAYSALKCKWVTTSTDNFTL